MRFLGGGEGRGGGVGGTPIITASRLQGIGLLQVERSRFSRCLNVSGLRMVKDVKGLLGVLDEGTQGV